MTEHGGVRTESATEELRRMLDERWVKHNDPAEWLTYWHDTDGHVWSASEMRTGLLSVSTAGVGSLTPEQAIAATLGDADLAAENAKLREESSKYNDLYAHAIADAEVWHLQWSAEHQENAKLRELIADVHEALCADKAGMFHRLTLASMEDDMRELGLVDE